MSAKFNEESHFLRLNNNLFLTLTLICRGRTSNLTRYSHIAGYSVRMKSLKVSNTNFLEVILSYKHEILRKESSEVRYIKPDVIICI